ncbi:MAG: biopolymer transporter ExbD [Tannerella sp.]|jgi:biopolymer transport protein ExbD|nr:biopolymer transporter ExbD [Tannerella sp.]
MAEVNTGEGKEAKKGQPKRQQLRVDFTPMVDMNMLLITFFMFCTTLSKPQMMYLVMPSKDSDKVIDEEKPKVDETKTVTLMLGGGDSIFYYLGKPNYEDWQSVVVTDYSPDGLRKLLLERNLDRIQKIAQLRIDKAQSKITAEQFETQSKEIRNAKDGQVVVIKPTESSTFENLVKILDEMQICSIATYAIVEMKEGDKFLIDNYLQQGALSAQASAAKPAARR